MLKTTRWYPDTCDCIYTYTWDDSIPEEQRVLSPAVVEKRCTAHTGLSRTALHNAVTDENVRKNRVHARALEIFKNTPLVRVMRDEAGDVILDAIGDPVVDWAKGVSFDFSFDGNRVLQIAITGLNAIQQTSLQSAVDQRVGAGKVRVV